MVAALLISSIAITVSVLSILVFKYFQEPPIVVSPDSLERKDLMAFYQASKYD